MGRAPISYNPFDPVAMTDPYPIYRALRDESPLHWSEGAACWVLSRYDDVAAALRDPLTYSSASGVFPTAGAPGMADLFLPMLIMTDPPRHTGSPRV
jgi:cytochrome P450